MWKTEKLWVKTWIENSNGCKCMKCCYCYEKDEIIDWIWNRLFGSQRLSIWFRMECGCECARARTPYACLTDFSFNSHKFSQPDERGKTCIFGKWLKCEFVMKQIEKTKRTSPKKSKWKIKLKKITQNGQHTKPNAIAKRHKMERTQKKSSNHNNNNNEKKSAKWCGKLSMNRRFLTPAIA